MSAQVKSNSKKHSLRRRISLAAGLVIFFGVFLSSGLVTWNGFNREINQQVGNLSTTAKIFSTTIAEPLAKNDRRQVQISLTGIGKLPGFMFASVKTNDNQTFAEMGFGTILKGKDEGLTETNPFNLLFRDRIWVADDIINSGTKIGTLKLLANITDIRKGLVFSLLLNLLASVLFSILAMWLCWRFVSNLTRPLYTMSVAMDRYLNDEDQSARAEEGQTGELGVLANSFNSMMDGISQRDKSLLEHQRNLENKVEERTADLLVATKEAQEANAAKSEFLATMSHEIRTPMNGMLVMAELLATAQLPAKQRRYAEIVLKSGNGLLTIINDILDFSKIQSGQLSIETVDVDFRVLLEDAMSLYWEQVSNKGLSLGCRVASTVPKNLIGDPTRLNQVVTNLLNNALKFTQEGEIFIDVEMVEQDGKGALRVEVKDTGIGIAENNIDAIFENFTQADQSTTRQYGGTGLGLAICKNLVEAMNGKIWIESEEGIGSSFIFTMPTDEVTANVAQRIPSPSSDKILVALPDGLAKQIIEDQLTSMQYEFVCSTDLQLDTEYLASFDWVFSDLEFYKHHYFTNEKQVRVSLSKLGDTDLENLIAASAVHDFISVPVSNFRVDECVKRIVNCKSGRNTKIGSLIKLENNFASYKGNAVLVAEDGAVNREVIQQALRQFEIEPIFATSGVEAIKQFKEQAFDLVFMDCNMPEMDGFDATVELRAYETKMGQKRVPIIALTAHIEAAIQERVENSEIDDLIVKPFTMGQLQDGLEQWLGKGATKSKVDFKQEIEINSENSSAIFNEAVIENLQAISGDESEKMIVHLHSLFLANAPDSFDKLRVAFSENDFEELASISHHLRSMSMNIGALNLSNSLEKLEHAAANKECLVEFTIAEQEGIKVLEALEGENQDVNKIKSQIVR